VSVATADLEFLTSERGERLLGSLAEGDLSESNTLSLLTHIRKSHTADEARSALTLAQLRHKAAEKFGDSAAGMFFTDSALQQASDPLIRQYRAEGFAGQRILDLCCGIGADSLAFAEQGCETLGVDIDPMRTEMARLNAQAFGLGELARFEVADIRDYTPNSAFDVVFFDPARRDAQGRRIYDVERYIPPLSTLRRFDATNVLAKLSPGVDLDQVADYPAAVEFISVKGDLKEGLLRYGEGAPLATLLTKDGRYHWRRESTPEARPLSSPLGWLVEPDPALIRSGLVEDAAEAFDGHQLDETIAYITSEHQSESVWARVWQIHDWMPFQLKKLRAYLRERDVGRATVKKRGSPLSPEELIGKLKLKGDNACTLVLTRLKGEPIVIICAEYPV
jgi:SAM-dependent methyltransferase